MGKLEKYAKERDKAFIKAVMEDDFSEWMKLSKKYRMKVPTNERVLRAGIYKAVQECTNIPADVKRVAMHKCCELGFSPFIKMKARNKKDDD